MKVLTKDFEFLSEPANPDSQNETSAAQLVYLCGLFCHFEGAMHGQYSNAGAEYQSLSFGR